MKISPLRFILILALVLTTFGSFLKTTNVAADTPADVLASYTVSITPQSDGTLIMDYKLANYCTYSDWPSDQPYLQVGVPNPISKEDITGFGPQGKVVDAEAVNGNFVQLDFDQGNLPKNGDCFDLNFTVHQSNMVHPDPTNGNDTFEFFPAGWNFPIDVKQITINWALPSDPKLVLVTDPAPTSTDSSNMTWTWDNPQMDPSQMFTGATVKLAYDKSAFTLPVAPPPAPVTQSQPVDTGSAPDGGNALLVFLVVIALIIIAGLIIAWVASLFGGSNDGLGSSFASDSSYTPPVYTRTSSRSRRSSSDDDDSSSSTSSYSPPSHPSSPPSSYGGGFGSSSGHSSGCVSMPSCACACACAGGGKVGCMLKMLGIKIGCLKKVIDEMITPAPAL